MRLWPRSMTGQMLLAVAVALLLVQGLGAFLLIRVQIERREEAILSAAAFRLTASAKGGERLEHMPPRRWTPAEGHRAFRIAYSATSPLHAGERRDRSAEAALAHILEDQGIAIAQIVVTHRDMRDDAVAMARTTMRAARMGHPPIPPEGRIMVVGLRLHDSDHWLVSRVWTPRDVADLVLPLIAQTAIIYLVLVTTVALVMRRITLPLARLTDRLEAFARTRDAGGQIAPEGPDDIRRLIEAHNAMESRIVGLLDEKDVMLGAIGHDLKTPLAALRVRIESVEDDAERARMAATIEDIARSLDDMLSLARVGRPGETPERVELSALVASIVEEYEDMEKPVELGDTRRIVLTLRPTWLRRALRNLIDNALRYGGGARVALAQDAGKVRIRVDDDGPGIAEDSLAAMMAPFTRGEPSRNSATGGAGLGLTLARAVAEQHGGTLVLSNRPEGGLRAEICLPV